MRNQSESIVVSKQPELSQSKNCTAAITQVGSLYYPWMVVQCDAKYEAVFVWQDLKSHRPPIKVAVNRTCDGDWFMINGSNKCFLIFWPNVALSFNQAQYICSAQNAPVFTVDVMSRNASRQAGNALRRELLQIKADVDNSKILHSISDVNMYKSVFGQILASDSSDSRLPFIITQFLKTPSEFIDVVCFAYVNHSCSVVEKSLVTYILDYEPFRSVERRGWGVKCRSCSEPLNVTGIICEKDSKPYIINCLSLHFRCNDGTCIVGIYRCDSVAHCFDDSDEDHCHNYINNMSNQFVSVPFLLSDISQRTETMRISNHSICDGIYPKTLSHEHELCFKYTIKKINVSLATNIDLLSENKPFLIKAVDLINLYVQEKKLCLKFQKHVTTYVNHTQYLYRDMVFKTIKKETKFSDLKKSCFVGVDGLRCHTPNSLSECVHLAAQVYSNVTGIIVFTCHQFAMDNMTVMKVRMRYFVRCHLVQDC